jgi:hypothetical protein
VYEMYKIMYQNSIQGFAKHVEDLPTRSSVDEFLELREGLAKAMGLYPKLALGRLEIYDKDKLQGTYFYHHKDNEE